MLHTVLSALVARRRLRRRLDRPSRERDDAPPVR